MTTLMRRGFASTLLGTAALFFAGCGGGGSGPSPVNTPIPNGTVTPTPISTGPIGDSAVRAGETIFVSNRANPSSKITDIYKLRANGSVVRLTNLGKVIDKPSVSSDGSRIVFQFDDPYTLTSGAADSDIEIGLVRTDAGRLGNGQNFQQLTTDTQTAFVHNRPDDYNPVFSPDDSYIYWTSNRGGAPHIWKMDGATGGEGANQIQFISQQSAYPSVASNGNIAYVDYTVPGSPLAISNSGGGLIKRIPVSFVTDTTLVFDIGLSPDSKRVAFSVGETAPRTTRAHVSVANVDTASIEGGLDQGSSGYGGSAWRDSNTLYFNAVNGVSNTRIILSTTPALLYATTTTVVDGPGDGYSPAFLPVR